jgi:hypothetical protein
VCEGGGRRSERPGIGDDSCGKEETGRGGWAEEDSKGLIKYTSHYAGC